MLREEKRKLHCFVLKQHSKGTFVFNLAHWGFDVSLMSIIHFTFPILSGPFSPKPAYSETQSRRQWRPK